MRVIISPAKKMNTDTDSFEVLSLPDFLPETGILLRALRLMSENELQALWKCNDSIARMNTERLRTMELDRNLTPAILSYEGIQYQYMAPGVMSERELGYLQEHLRILSGFYGMLRPFDGVTPYRLEMQAALRVGGAKDLYAFWSRRLADALTSETDLVVDLASKEYSRAVLPYLPERIRTLTCVFGQREKGKLVEKGTLCKMARGQMVRWMAENKVEKPEELQSFSDLDYRFDPESSTAEQYVFIKGGRYYVGGWNKGAGVFTAGQGRKHGFPF